MLGISKDPPEAQRRFKETHQLPFPLLSDADLAVQKAWGVWKEKTSYGKKRMGIKRSTFLIDAEGRVERALYGVRPEGHADEVLEALSA